MTPEAPKPTAAAPCPSPRVCAHEPIIREGLESGHSIAAVAVSVLTTLRRVVLLLDTCRGSLTIYSDSSGANELRHAAAALEDALREPGPVFQRAYQLVSQEAPWIVTDCVSRQIVERDATIRGLNDRVAGLLEEARRATGARERALAELAHLELWQEQQMQRSREAAAGIPDADGLAPSAICQRLRARVETLETALRDIRDLDTVQQGRTVSDLDLLYQAKGRAAAVLKKGTTQAQNAASAETRPDRRQALPATEAENV